MSPLYAEVIGDPIAHSKSPLIHRFWLGKLSIAADYRAVRVSPGMLPDYLKERRTDSAWRGCNVTAPLKQIVMPELDRIKAPADRIGAVNTICRDAGELVGANTDKDGFAEPLPDVSGRTAVLFGTGGAARAVLTALIESGIGQITVVARSAERATAMLAGSGLPSKVQGFETPLPPADMVVNATTLGMHGRPLLRVDLSPLPPHALVYDLVYAPLDTDLLRAARARALATVDGLAMLIGQAARAFELFFCAPAPRQHDAELRDLLLR